MFNNAIYTVVKEKTNALGLWKDENGKVYIDNIKLFFPKSVSEYEAKLYSLFASGEKAVFVRGREKAYIEDKEGSIQELSNKVTIQKLKGERLSHNEIKDLLNMYGGLTIFNTGLGYIIEAWLA